jgi:hypothetical protein
MTLRTLIELKDYHLAESLKPQGSCDLTAGNQANWHAEVVKQVDELTKAMTTAFPGLKDHLATITDCARCEQTGHGVLVG